MIGAFIFTVVIALCARRRSLRLWGIAVAVTAGLALVSWVGMNDSVRARLATLLNQETISEDRISHWGDGLKAAADFWQLGSGLGTYRYVYRPYQQRLSEGWYYHAENEYLEAVVEGGIPGLGLMLSMIALVGAAGWRLLRNDRDARTFAFGIAGVFALTSQAIHAFSDFGLHIAGNMLLLALLCGSMSGRAAELAKHRSSPRFMGLPHTRHLSTFLLALLLAASIWGYLQLRGIAAAQAALEQVRFTETPTGATAEALLDAAKRLGAALERRPDDAEAHRRMAQLWVHLYRSHALEQLRHETQSGVDETRLWELTSPAVIHGRAHQFARHNLSSELESLRSQPIIRDHLRRALKHSILARRACPLLPEVHLMIAELCVLAGDPANDQIHIERSQRLAPADPDLFFRCGLLELQAGRLDSACDSWRRSLSLSSRHLADILPLAGRQLSLWHTVEKVLPDSPALLIRLARGRYQGDQHASIRGMLIKRAERLIKQADLPEDERCYLRGSLFALKGLYGQAILNLSRATELRWQELNWRHELALLLKQQGRIAEAYEHARLCARMDPNNSRYRRLLREITHTQLTAHSRAE